MPKARYEQIYEILKNRIETGEYKQQKFLPSENTLIVDFSCSRNTLRRAISELVKLGYVQTMQGKGVVCIFKPTEQATFTLGTIESFSESSMRTGWKGRNEVIHFETCSSDEKIAEKTGFELGTQLYYVQRLHYMNDIPMILNHSYFRQDIAYNLTEDIAKNSIYEYLEKELNVNIISSKRIVTVELKNELDAKYLDLQLYNCLAVVSSQTYDSNGTMFEFTESRHHPQFFRFQDHAVRKK